MLIALYNEMRNRHGFGDGACSPQGIKKVRDKIIGLINNGLPRNSKIEAYAFDKPDIHNWCMICYRNKKTHTESGHPTVEVMSILIRAQQKGTIAPRLTIIA